MENINTQGEACAGSKGYQGCVCLKWTRNINKLYLHNPFCVSFRILKILFLVHLLRPLMSLFLLQESGWWPSCPPPSCVWAICSTYWPVTGKRTLGVICVSSASTFLKIPEQWQQYPNWNQEGVHGPGTASLIGNKTQNENTIDLSFYHKLDIVLRIFWFLLQPWEVVSALFLQLRRLRLNKITHPSH